MGTLSVQPPSGASRSLTEVFILLRNNAIQSRQIFAGDSAGGGGGAFGGGDRTEDRMSLIPLNEGDERDVESGGAGGTGASRASPVSRMPPEWVSVADEVQYEMTRIRSRLKDLKESQQSHLSRPSFNDDGSQAEETRIEQMTQDVTQMLTHCQRLVQHVQAYEGSARTRGDKVLLRNAVQSLIAALQSVTYEFRSSQGVYLNQVQTRDDSLQHYFTQHDQPAISFASTSQGSPTMRHISSMPVFDAELDLGSGSAGHKSLHHNRTQEGELTMAQIQAMEENTDMVREREREILHVSKSIVELNTLFKDLAQFVVDQGTILDRIDFNLEQTDIRVKAGFADVQKAERYQRKNRKMMCIMMLAGAIMFMLLLFLLFRT